MAKNWQRWVLALTLAGGIPATAASAADNSDGKYRDAVRRAVEVLPRHPAQVLVIDPNDAKPEDRAYLLKLQAFILKGSATIYLNKHSDVLRGAIKGSRFHEYLLATVIWHEMAHVDGADEAEARRREEALWTRFLADGVVDREAGLNYLVALKHRPPQSDEASSVMAQR